MLYLITSGIRGWSFAIMKKFSGIEIRSDGLELALKSGKKIKGDALLWCNGRTGNTDELCLESAGPRG